APRALRLAGRGRLPGSGALRHAVRVRWARGEGTADMSVARCDALVFFGATGDLAYKKIFPALHAMARRGHLDVPVVGVARRGWPVRDVPTARAWFWRSRSGATCRRRRL